MFLDVCLVEASGVVAFQRRETRESGDAANSRRTAANALAKRSRAKAGAFGKIAAKQERANVEKRGERRTADVGRNRGNGEKNGERERTVGFFAEIRWIFRFSPLRGSAFGL